MKKISPRKDLIIRTKSEPRMHHDSERVPTGIKGLDEIIGGGFIPSSVNLVSGGAGAGKTVFALQFLYTGALRGEKGLFISMEEELQDLKDDAKTFGWDFDKLEAEGKVKFVYIYPYEITNFQTLLINEIAQVGAKRVVIDSTSVLGMALDNEFEVRKQLYAFASQLKRVGCTSILTSEIVDLKNNRFSRFGVEEFVADSVITLHLLSDFKIKESQRAMHIVKMRRTQIPHNLIPIKITPQGLVVLKK
ncbi:MAG: RAD55 family ATPase [Candidatus Woesearchaeota archaeon]